MNHPPASSWPRAVARPAPTQAAAAVRSWLDHLVVVADTLEQGAAWCEATLGVAPVPGGKHVLMGTHNRLLNVSGPAFPRAYLEIIAIDPEGQAPSHARWFGMDDPALQAAVKQSPCWVHVVAATSDVRAACRALAAVGEDPGRPWTASRNTPQGELRWQITVRSDGQLPHGGALPTLIEWGEAHPTDALPASGVRLESVTVSGACPDALRAGHEALGLERIALHEESSAGRGFTLRAVLNTPRGPVTLTGGR